MPVHDRDSSSYNSTSNGTERGESGTPDVTDFRGMILAVSDDDDDMLAIPKWNMLNSRSLEIDSKL